MPTDTTGDAAAPREERVMRELDCEYYARRQRECLARAEAASDERVGRIHRAFAAAYEARLHDDAIQRPRYSAWR